MCTMIAAKVPVAGSAKAAEGWVRIEEALISCDHATHAWADHAVRIDFLNTAIPDACVAVEIDIGSARTLVARLTEVIAAAESSGVALEERFVTRVL